jgi:3-hydroxyisobutyrate dehydrogenase-like beta-hydroxyacid dehydrogenase
MGHGIARNILAKGHPLVLLEHPGNQPVEDLIAEGATTARSSRKLAAESEVIILCVTGSPQVEAVLTGDDGVLGGLQPGATVVDCSTAIPASSERMAAFVEKAGGRFIDAPMTRTAQHAREGRLNLLVGGDAQVLQQVDPLLRCFAENITHAGPVGSGHRLKLLHNFVSLGCVTLIAEAAACAENGGIPAETFVATLAAGGGSGAALERLKPYLLHRDASGLQFSIANAAKDLHYYVRMANDAAAVHRIADALAGTLDEAATRSEGKAMLPELVSLLARSGRESAAA